MSDAPHADLLALLEREAESWSECPDCARLERELQKRDGEGQRLAARIWDLECEVLELQAEIERLKEPG